MTTATVLLASLLCLSADAAEAAPVFACNRSAITAAERPRYDELFRRVRAAVRDRSEVASGYAFRLDGKAVTLPEVAEWMAMERRCCPFFTLDVATSGGDPDCWMLTLTGPAGVKAVLEAEFPLH